MATIDEMVIAEAALVGIRFEQHEFAALPRGSYWIPVYPDGGRGSTYTTLAHAARNALAYWKMANAKM